MLSAKEQEIFDALDSFYEKGDIEIVTVEVVGSKKSPTIRVYIDTLRGVSFDELSSAQGWINSVMDKLDPFPGAYVLEVSSPGLDRPLRTKQHFADQIGQQCVVKTVKPIENKSTFTGKIIDSKDSCILVNVDGVDISIEYANIKKANLKAKIDFKTTRKDD